MTTIKTLVKKEFKKVVLIDDTKHQFRYIVKEGHDMNIRDEYKAYMLLKNLNSS